MKDAVLITGINGFIGSKLAEFFLKKNYKVFGFVRPTSDLSFLKGLDVKLFTVNLDSDSTLPFRELPERLYIIHAAAITSDWGPLDLFLKVNVKGTEKILNLAHKLKTKKLVILSSVAVMGFGHYDSNESAPKKRSNIPYIISKRIMEENSLLIAKKKGIPLVILRPGDVYGENDRVTTRKLFSAIEKNMMGFVSNGKALLAPLYIKNLCQAVNLALIKKEANGKIFFITDDVKINWKEYIEKICKHLGCKTPSLNVPFFIAYFIASFLEIIYKILNSKNPPLFTRYRILHAGKDFYFNISNAKKILNYKPDKNIDKNIEKTVKWYKKDKEKKLRILITGISGAWGWHLSKNLINKDYEIIGTYFKGETPQEVKKVQLDLLYSSQIKKVMKDIKPDIVIHTAAMARPVDCENNKELAWQINFESVKNFISEVNLYKSRFIFFSTDLVYSDSNKYHTEKEKPLPVNTYEKTKVKAEEFIIKNCYDYLILRVAHTYGPGSPSHPSSTDRLIHSLKNKEKVSIATDQIRTPVYIFDGINGIDYLIHKGIKRIIINLGGTETLSRFELSVKIARILNLDLSLVQKTRTDTTKLKPRYSVLMDSSLLRSTGFKTLPLKRHSKSLKNYYKSLK